MMKKLTMMMIGLFTVGVASCQAEREKVIDVNQLPEVAGNFVSEHFADSRVAVAKMENLWRNKSYEVYFTNGDHIDFDRNGNWEEIECKTTAVPTAVVPTAIQEYVAKTYPGERIKKLERDRWKYEVKLSNHIELTFDLKYNLKDVDM